MSHTAPSESTALVDHALGTRFVDRDELRLGLGCAGGVVVELLSDEREKLAVKSSEMTEDVIDTVAFVLDCPPITSKVLLRGNTTAVWP